MAVGLSVCGELLRSPALVGDAGRSVIRYRGVSLATLCGSQARQVGETTGVIDLREPEDVAVALDRARGSLERGAEVPREVSTLLVEIADALADTGPLEIGVSARDWERAAAAADQTLDRVGDESSRRRRDSVPRELRKLSRRLRKLHGGAVCSLDAGLRVLALHPNQVAAALVTAGGQRSKSSSAYCGLSGPPGTN